MSIRLKIQILLLGIFFLALGNAFFVLKSEKNAQKQFEWISHRDNVVRTTQTLVKSIYEAESIQLDYLLTGNKEYIKKYDLLAKKIKTSIKDLISYNIKDANEHINQIKSIDSLIEKKLLTLDENMLSLNSNAKACLTKPDLLNKNKSDINQILSSIEALNTMENNNLIEREKEYKKSQRMLKIFIFIEAIGLILLSIFAWFVLKIILIKPLEQLLVFTKKVESIDDDSTQTQDGKKTFKLNEIDEIKTLSSKFDILQQKLIEQNILINSVINSSKDMIFYKDYSNSEGVYIGCNNAFCKFTGKSKKEIIGKKDHEVFSKNTVIDFQCEDYNVIQEDKTHTNERWLKDFSNKDVLIQTVKTPLYNHHKSIIGVLGVSRDITDKYHSQKELEDKNKMLHEQSKHASMGEMIGNIAHQWRQPLSAISAGVINLKLEKELETLDDETFYRICNSIEDNSQYLSTTINDFTDFIKGNRRKVTFNLKENIHSFLNLVEGTIREHNINLVEDIEDDFISGYPNELIQCFINIFNNAKDALKDEKEKYIFISSHKDVEKSIMKIIIRDNAGGIPDDVAPKIFEPYFTTKHKSQGTGLGLNMTYKLIVDGMKGSIKTSNVKYNYNYKEYVGAEFVISIPI
jgi:PAS domain S-box-containing protein